MKKTLLCLAALWGLMVVGCTSDEPQLSLIDEDSKAVESVASDDPDFVTQEDLDDVVVKFLKSDVQSRSSVSNYTTSLVNGRSGKPAFYVVNFDNDGGFMLVSANKNYAPVLAYVESGAFSPDIYVTPGIADWLIDTTEAIDNIDSASDSIKSRMQSLWSPLLRKRSLSESEKNALLSRGAQIGDRNNHPELIPIMQDSIRKWEARGWTVWYFEDYPFTEPSRDEMIQNMQSAADWRYIDDAAALSLVVKKTTVRNGGVPTDISGLKWNQTEPWNYGFPMLNDNKTRALAGCVPVAVGQIMRHYRYPTYFDWDKMYPTVATATTQMFLYQLAVKMNSDMHMDEVGDDRHTSTNTGAAISALKDYGYQVMESSSSATPPCLVTSDMKYPGKKDGSHMYIIWDRKVNSIDESTECYTFVRKAEMKSCYKLSNYTTSQESFYVNWGWGGLYDGVYYNPANDVPAGSGFTYNKIKKYIIPRK